jgi:hypothetical protein
MTALVLLFAAACITHPCPPPPPLTPLGSGLATYYADGLFDEVIINRGIVVPYDVIGFAALLDAQHIGQRVWLRWPDGTLDGPYLVSDCANAAHRGDLLARGWIVDIDRATARLHGMRGPVGPVIVYVEN